jgi:hypothetical protein
MTMDRIPSALELTPDQLIALRNIVAGGFTPTSGIGLQDRTRLTELGLIRGAMGGIIASPAGRMVARL